ADEDAHFSSLPPLSPTAIIEQVQDNEPSLPKSAEDALEGPESKEWRSAIMEELRMLEKMGTWELVDLPANRTPVGNRCVFAKKKDDQGCVICYKARLVAQGFSQKPGEDFNHNGAFAPVMRLDTFRSMTALATINK